MHSIRSRQLGVIWLVVMYLVMMVLFFWHFYAALIVFSITFFICFVFRNYLPDMPYPAVDKRNLIPGYRAMLLCYLTFAAPVLIVTIAYQVCLFLDPVYIRDSWPIERFFPVTGADLFNYRWALESRASNAYKYDAIYFMIKGVNVIFFVFVFFVAHWSLGAIPFLKKAYDRNVYFGESGLWWLTLILGCCFFYLILFVGFYTVVGGEPSSGGGYTNIVRDFYNNRLLVFGAFNFFAVVYFGLPWVFINGVLLKMLSVRGW